MTIALEKNLGYKEAVQYIVGATVRVDWDGCKGECKLVPMVVWYGHYLLDGVNFPS